MPGFEKRGPRTQRDGYKVAIWLRDATSPAATVSGDPVTFEINPEEVDVYYPSRITTQQTIGGAYQDNWGPGVGKVQLSGVTGWGVKRPSDPTAQDGYQFFITLRELHKRYQELCRENDPNTVTLLILLPPGDFSTAGGIAAADTATAPQQGGVLNGAAPAGTQFGFFRVSSDNFESSQSKSEPQLYRYRWEMTILQDLLATTAGNPSTPFLVDPGSLQGIPDPLGGITPPPPDDPNAPTSTAPPPPSGTNPGGLNPGDGSPQGGGPQKQKVPKDQAAKDAFAAQQAAGEVTQQAPIPVGKSPAQVLASLGISPEEYQKYANVGVPGGISYTPVLNTPLTTPGTLNYPPPSWLQTYRSETQTSGPQTKPST